jgi:DNA-binding transcriptional regulator YiaG
MTATPPTPDELKSLLWQANMLNRELAELAGVSERTVYYWLSGRVKTPRAVVELLRLRVQLSGQSL